VSRRHRSRRPSHAPAVFALLFLAALGGAGAYLWKYHPGWLALPSRPTTPAAAPRTQPTVRYAPTEPLRPKTVTAHLHFARLVNGEVKLVPVARSLPAKAPAQAALQELLSGSLPTGDSRPLPPGVKLRRVYIQAGTAVVDFSRELVTNFRGGASAEKAAVYAVVSTLTSLPGVQRVQFLVEGKKIDSLGGHLDLSEPLAAPSAKG
jgi:spore germination protein GerM